MQSKDVQHRTAMVGRGLKVNTTKATPEAVQSAMCSHIAGSLPPGTKAKSARASHMDGSKAWGEDRKESYVTHLVGLGRTRTGNPMSGSGQHKG